MRNSQGHPVMGESRSTTLSHVIKGRDHAGTIHSVSCAEEDRNTKVLRCLSTFWAFSPSTLTSFWKTQQRLQPWVLRVTWYGKLNNFRLCVLHIRLLSYI